MTVQELRNLLTVYPQDAEVCVYFSPENPKDGVMAVNEEDVVLTEGWEPDVVIIRKLNGDHERS